MLGSKEEIANELLSNAQIGISLLECENLMPVYENELFSNWFPMPQGKSSLPDRIKTIKTDRLKKKLSKGSDYSVEYEIKVNNRSKIIKLHFSQSTDSSIFVRAMDYTKEKEVEYLLDSYIKMSEDDKKRLEDSLTLIKAQKEELTRTNSELERERNSIELRALQAIINPHFVSNCLASIQRFIVDNDTELSVNYLSHFGKLMRMSFEQSYNDYVSISDIIQLLNTYVRIEKIRIDHDWDFVLNLDETLDLENSKIPPLLIQPFLENAIWHGINNKTEGGKVAISMKMLDEITLKCTIEDNGAGRKARPESQKRTKAALHSLNVTGKRLDIMWEEYEKGHEITYTDLFTKEGVPCGTKVELFIPISF